MGANSGKHEIFGMFAYYDDLEKAARHLKNRPVHIKTVYSPVPLDDLYETLGMGRTPIRFITLAAAIFGFCLAFGTATFTALQWDLIIQGKPVIAPIPFFLVSYEWALLFGVIATVISAILLGGMPRRTLPETYDARFGSDHFGLVVRIDAKDREEITEFFEKNGAVSVYEID